MMVIVMMIKECDVVDDDGMVSQLGALLYPPVLCQPFAKCQIAKHKMNRMYTKYHDIT